MNTKKRAENVLIFRVKLFANFFGEFIVGFYIGDFELCKNYFSKNVP